MNREDALKKIKKCLALAKGAGAGTHEAAAALRQAQKLMAEHCVSDRDVELTDVREVRIRAVSSAINAWELALVDVVAEAFGCEYFTGTQDGFTTAGNFFLHRVYAFVGINAAAQVAGYAYEVLSRKCAKARLEHIRKQSKNCKPITKTARGDAFAMGWVVAVERLVERFAKPTKNETLLLAYMEAKHPGLVDAKVRNSTKKRRPDYGHRVAGFRAGSEVELNHGIGATAPTGLLA